MIWSIATRITLRHTMYLSDHGSIPHIDWFVTASSSVANITYVFKNDNMLAHIGEVKHVALTGHSTLLACNYQILFFDLAWIDPAQDFPHF